MAIIDTSYIEEFYQAEKIKFYVELMNYMKKFTKETYVKWNILVQLHHIIPSFECDDLDKETEIWLPVLIHFKAHILRAREWYANWYSNFRTNNTGDIDSYNKYMGNYTEAYCILKRFPELQGIFWNDWKEAEEHYQKWYKPKTYEAAFGKKKAAKIKKKISIAMSNLDPEVIEQRNKKITEYAASRPKSHNDAISKAKMKTIVNVTTNKIYSNVILASIDTGLSISSIRKCCQGRLKTVSNQKFEYLV